MNAQLEHATLVAIGVLSLAVGACAQTKSTQDSASIHVIVLHTNDIHGQVLTRKATWLDKQNPPSIGGLPRIAARVEQVRAEAQASGAALLVVDAGDWYQGTPEGMVDEGLGFVQALELVKYDALCIGNHEFDHGVANVIRILEQAKLPAVCANLFELQDGKSGAHVPWVPSHRIVEIAGIKVAIIGLLTTVTPEITHPSSRSLDFADPVTVFERERKELAGKADWLLPLTHLGVDEDRRLARANADLPLIVGGHSHTYLKDGVTEGTTLIVQTGSKGSALGRVDLTLERKADRTLVCVSKSSKLIDLVDEPDGKLRNAPLEAQCAKLEQQSAERMKAVVGELGAPIARTKEPLKSSTAGNFMADMLREHTGADVGLMNRGGIRCDLEAGPITRRDLFELAPFDNQVSVLELDGAHLERCVRRAVEGTAHSGLEFSGLQAEVSVDLANKRHLERLRVGGTSLDPTKVYRVAMNSFMADGGDAYLDTPFTGKRVDLPLLVRDMLEERFKAQGKITPSAENRYVLHEQ